MSWSADRALASFHEIKVSKTLCFHMKSRSFSNLNIIKDFFEFVSIIGVGGRETDDVVLSLSLETRATDLKVAQ